MIRKSFEEMMAEADELDRAADQIESGNSQARVRFDEAMRTLREFIAGLSTRSCLTRCRSTPPCSNIFAARPTGLWR